MYTNLRQCLQDLDSQGELIQIEQEIDPDLVMAEIHRRVFDAKGPALLFKNVKGSPFQAASNIYGTWKRTEYIFHKSLAGIQLLVQAKVKPESVLKNWTKLPQLMMTALNALPTKRRSPKVLYQKTTIDQLPNVKSWPDDGGGFVTLPQVLSYPPDEASIMQSNIGMYRIQLNGNQYQQNEEIGLHYQIHRGIGVHHKAYLDSPAPFKVAIGIGGPPSHSVGAIMPLPEGMSEVTFTGLLGRRRYRYGLKDGYMFPGDADFVILGEVMKSKELPEGPFGDHLGYYSLEHPFPYMKVHEVWHRKDPIWHFTVVGRPPAEDSYFGKLIHEIAGDIGPSEYPGLVEINAVDAAGVHPLLLAVGQERYMPFREKKPEELLTIANHLLGKGQTSLAKYLLIVEQGNGEVNTHDIPSFLDYLLKRVKFDRDLHFYTNWTIDTLDYSGHDWNGGSKLVIAAAGEPIRMLCTEIPSHLNENRLIVNSTLIQPGIVGIEMGTFIDYNTAIKELSELTKLLEVNDNSTLPIIVLCDHSDFLSENLNNFLWVTFTRSNPSADIYGVHSRSENKHWACDAPMIIDARIKPHHAPPLIQDESVSQKVDEIMDNDHALKKYN